jgi:23S rRNA A2030 N6-methylase RlmJ
MLVVNPPWQFGAEALAWQSQLEGLLGATGGSRMRWLVREDG